MDEYKDMTTKNKIQAGVFKTGMLPNVNLTCPDKFTTCSIPARGHRINK